MTARTLDRRAMLALIRISPRCSTTREVVMKRTGPNDEAEFLGTMSGGDEEWVATNWRMLAVGHFTLLVRRQRLHNWLAGRGIGRFSGLETT